MPEQRSIEVPGGRLHYAVWPAPASAPTVLAIHGITSNHATWELVAANLAGVRVVAPDLRGRGASGELPGPFDLTTLAQDCAAVLAAEEIEQTVVAGHSMGGFVATRLTERHPELVRSLVLVDGGPPRPTPPLGPDGRPIGLEVALGPALARLSMTFDSPADYLDFWRAHPALAEDWNTGIEAYARADLSQAPPWRSRVNAEAVIAASAELAGADSGAVLGRIAAPADFVWSPRGLTNQDPLYPRDLTRRHVEALAHTRWLEAPDTNHYTILLGQTGAERIAEIIRAHLMPAKPIAQEGDSP